MRVLVDTMRESSSMMQRQPWDSFGMRTSTSQPPLAPLSGISFALAAEPILPHGVDAERTVREAEQDPFRAFLEVPGGARRAGWQGPGHPRLAAFRAEEGVGPGIGHGADLIEGFPGGHGEIQARI